MRDLCLETGGLTHFAMPHHQCMSGHCLQSLSTFLPASRSEGQSAATRFESWWCLHPSTPLFQAHHAAGHRDWSLLTYACSQTPPCQFQSFQFPVPAHFAPESAARHWEGLSTLSWTDWGPGFLTSNVNHTVKRRSTTSQNL